MNITGTFQSLDIGGKENSTGAFSDIIMSNTRPAVGSNGYDIKVTLNAANAWTGATSSAGGSKAHDIMNPYHACYIWRRTE